jgi:xyloglucan-specific exo-beta-1,4-glucanase
MVRAGGRPFTDAMLRILLASIAVFVLQAGESLWSQAPIGGGGAVTSVTVHPQVPGVVYLTTDVGGCYRGNGTGWTPLLDATRAGDSRYYGTESLAVDPADASGDWVIIATGKDAYGSDTGRIRVSQDRGATWTTVDEGVVVAANWDQRYSQRLAVDPLDGQVVYHAGRAGLRRSVDRGLTWATVAAAPTGDTTDLRTPGAASGCTAILVDGSAGAVGGRARRIWLATAGAGHLHRSDDSGATWAAVASAPSGIRRIVAIGSTGRVMLAHATGLSEIAADGLGVTPRTPTGETGNAFLALAADPADANHWLAARHDWSLGLPIYRSVDGGANWAEIANSDSFDVAWHGTEHVRAATFSLAFDQHHPGTVWYADWYRPWRTTAIGAATVWTSVSAGLEETVLAGSAIIAPRSGIRALFAGCADVTGFAWNAALDRPTSRITGLTGVSTPAICSLDWSEQTPSTLVALTASGWNAPGLVFRSLDGGTTWTSLGLPTGTVAGRIAISSDASAVVWAGSSGLWRWNGGTSWTQSAVTTAVIGSDIFATGHPLISDRAASNTFYALAGDGTLYRSSDGGANWTAGATGLAAGSVALASDPAAAGRVWLAHGSLRLSQDGGSSFASVGAFNDAHLVAVGPAPGGGTQVTVHGSRAGDRGVWASTDAGTTWFRISTATQAAGCEPRGIAADRRTPGRIHIGTGGRGILVADPPAAGGGPGSGSTSGAGSTGGSGCGVGTGAVIVACLAWVWVAGAWHAARILPSPFRVRVDRVEQRPPSTPCPNSSAPARCSNAASEWPPAP